MGIIRTFLNTAVISGASASAGWAFWTRHSKFVPFTTSDPIFSSSTYLQSNPNNNPPMHDLCVRKVPLSKIKPQLLEQEGKLAEAFCAGMWSGLGFEYQRSYLAKKYQNGATAHQLWSREQLKDSTYEVGTQFTDHFEVISKTPDTIAVRCGDSPLKTGVRDTDGMVILGAKINKEEGVAEFKLTSVFYQGLGASMTKPMPDYLEFAHRLYTKLLIETAFWNVLA